MQVRPQRHQRDEQPDPPRRSARLRAQEQQHETEEDEREELRAHDDEGRRRGEEHNDQHDGTRRIGRAERAHPERQQGQGRGRSDQLPEQQTLVAADDLEPMEDQLAEHRDVDPVGRGGGSIRNAGRNRALVDDRFSESREPARVGADGREDRAGAGPERDGKPGQARARRRALHPPSIGLEGATL